VIHLQADADVLPDGVVVVAGHQGQHPAATRQAQDFLHGQLREAGVDLSIVGLDGTLDSLVENVIDSAAFRGAVDAAVADAGDQLAGRATDAEGQARPYVVTLDAAGILHDRLTEEPLLALLLPDFPTLPVSFEAVSAEDIEELREAYRDAGFYATWAPRIAAAAVILGFVVSPRKRWFPAKLLLASGAAALAASAYLGARGVGLIEARLDAAGAGDAGPLFVDVATREALPNLTSLLERGGVAVLILGVLATIAAWIATRRIGSRLQSSPDKRNLEVPA